MLKSRLDYDLYHVSSGGDSACTFSEIFHASAKACNVELGADTYQKVSVHVVEELVVRLESHIGPGNPRRIMKAIRIVSESATLNHVFEIQQMKLIGKVEVLNL